MIPPPCSPLLDEDAIVNPPPGRSFREIGGVDGAHIAQFATPPPPQNSAAANFRRSKNSAPSNASETRGSRSKSSAKAKAKAEESEDSEDSGGPGRGAMDIPPTTKARLGYN